MTELAPEPPHQPTRLLSVRGRPPSRKPARQPDNELFDHGCDLVQAAVAIRGAAASREGSRAVPAVLGCLESVLEELLWATALLEATTAQRSASAARALSRRVIS